MRYLIGIDPGLNGGFGVLTQEAKKKGRGWEEPTIVKAGRIYGKRDRLPTMLDFSKLSQELEGYLTDDSIIIIEKVHSMPRDGVVSAFTFGGVFESLRLYFAGEKCVYVSPQVWKKSIGLTGKDKQASIDLALSLFPPASHFIPEGCRVPHDGASEATLIAYFWSKVSR
jgi:hypothetical protein